MGRKNFKEYILPALLICLVPAAVMSCGSSQSQTTPPSTKYTIGGSISGLSGTLVLQNNGGNNLTRTTNGSFAFSSALATGSAYNVTVSSQPSGQACTVTNGSGNVSGASVTNIQVACSSAAYTVGGTVYGLNGTVVLQNNGGDDLSVSANGSFTFSTSIADGSAYSATVLTQPSGQTCAVTGGDGTVSAEDVIDIRVTCSNNSYSVGGTVSGLNGTVVLQNNGSDNHTVTADGSFTFSTKVAHGSTYSVTVLTQPSNQTCTIAHGSGTIGAANVTNVQVSCADVAAFGWTFPESLSDGISTPGGAPQRSAVDIANNGDAVFAYYDSNAADTTYNVYKSERRNGVWTNAQDFTDGMSPFVNNTLHSSYYPDVAMADDGATMITWVFYDTDEASYLGDAFYKAEYRNDGSGWTYPIDGADRLNQSYGGTHEHPQFAMSGAGETVVSWSQNDISGYAGVYKSELSEAPGTLDYPSGSSNAISPDAGSYPAADAPSVAVNDSGDSIIAWRQTYDYNTSDYRILMSEYDSSSGTWTNPGIDDFISPLTGDAQDPKAAISDNGDAIIVWEEPSATYIQGPIYVSEKRSGVWTHPASLDDFLANGDDPQVAMDDNGNAVIVWAQQDESYYRIFMREYRTGVWGSPVAISPSSTSPYAPHDPKVAMAGNGDVVIIWQQRESTGTYDQLFMSEKRNGVWAHPASLNAYISLDGNTAGSVGASEDGPCLAVNDNGDTIIVWEQHDGSNELMFKAEYKKP